MSLEISKEKRKNSVTIVGVVDTINRSREGLNDNGLNYIAGDIMIRSKVAGNDKDQFYKIPFYLTDKYGTSGKENPNYTRLLDLNNGEMVSISAEIQGNRFFAQDRNDIIVTNRLRLNFINKPRETDVQGATFNFLGFVTKELTEVRNASDELMHYTVTIAQSKYRSDLGLDVITFVVDKNNTAIVNGVRSSYKVGTTANVSGVITGDIVQNVVKEDSIFGAPTERVYQNHIMNYVLTSGLLVPDTAKYNENEISTLVRNTAAVDEELKNKPAANNSGAGSFEAKSEPLGKNLNQILGL